MDSSWLSWMGWTAIGTAAILIALELGLRLRFGFGKPLIYTADPQIGYLLTPNQSTRRFGKQISINQYSMRSPEISPTRSPDTLRVLLLGDSIANGGWWTDQDQTIAALLQRQGLAGYDRVEVLNASANSWSPRNELAYLQKFGTFEAQAIVQILNTDDLFGIAPYSIVVGRDPNYPDRLPPLAIVEVLNQVLNRYLSKPAPIPELKQLWQADGDRVGENLAAIEQVQAIARQQNARLLLVITPLLREVKDGSRDYEVKARQRLSQFAQQQQIPFVDILPLFAGAAPPPGSLYVDTIHLSQTGNLQVVEQISQQIPKLLP